ncbi:MAG: endo-1,4-beta-xylanase, partial [Lachnospiraceae bacterium]|nr:endo-1,4-beta-xylanase [Lachnospiraceae bacterium]
ADENNTNSFYVDNLSITENDADLSIAQDSTSLKDYFASVNPEHDFRVGTALTADILSNDNKMQLVKKHYNSVTAGNEMKPDYIIKGLNEDGSLKLDFSTPDAMLDAFWEHNQGKAEKDQIHVRGHVLCWHSQTPDFFFKDTKGNLLSKDAMNLRIEEYIKKVLAHVNEKYPGLIYCWDVVNEAIIPSDGEKGGLRVYAGGKETYYHQIYKDSNEYIVNAFTYASKYAEKGVKLFYNDYGETEPTKVKCISGLADAIKAGGGRIDGIGMQAHYSMESPGAEEFYNAITEYSRHVDEVQITELDMLASKSYDGSDAQKEAELVKQAYRYKEFVDTILKAKDDGANVTALVFWGVADDDSWLISPEFSDGRHNMPLLFDETLRQNQHTGQLLTLQSLRQI